MRSTILLAAATLFVSACGSEDPAGTAGSGGEAGSHVLLRTFAVTPVQGFSLEGGVPKPHGDIERPWSQLEPRK